MSSTNKRFLIAYALLVGLPLAGLPIVLRHGRNLAAPISVDGVWKMQVDATQLAALPCAAYLTSEQNPSLIISQSGEGFTVNLGGLKSRDAGVIEGTALRASLPAQSNEKSCTGEQQLNLLASVDPNANPRSLAGTLSVEGCQSCPPVAFHAVRQLPEKKRGH